jgi:N-acetylmuramic acid 6-phosphate etherase
MTEDDGAAGLNLEGLVTETAQPGRTTLDLAATDELVQLMAAEDALVPPAVAGASEAIAKAIDVVVERLSRGGRLIYVGAGTAGRTGVVDAAESGPTFNSPPGQVVGVMAGGANAFVTPVEGAEDDAQGGRRDLERLRLEADDVVVAVSASGRTPYVLGAAAYARTVGAATVGVACNVEAALSAGVDVPIEVVVGPEFIAGSTRLKAGTAQKLVLNMISTIAMVRLGKTFGNLMVDVRATSEKLRARVVRIVAQAAGATDDAAAGALAAAEGDAKAAILMLRRGLSADDARRRLDACGRNLRRALDGDACA